MTTVEAWWLSDQENAVVLDDEAAVDKFLVELAAEPAARLVSLFVGGHLDEIHSGGLPAVEFLVGVGGDVPLGVLRFADVDGQWISKNPATEPDGEPVAYHYMAVVEEFPRDAELPLDLVRAAVLEYVRNGQRPKCVEWQPGA